MDHFDLIHNELEMDTNATIEIKMTRNVLESKAYIARNVVKFLNNITKGKLEELKENNMTYMFKESNKVIIKGT